MSIEYEVEMAIVFGKAGKYISANRAYDHVFGYMVAMDVSDRGGRPPGPRSPAHGPDALAGRRQGPLRHGAPGRGAAPGRRSR